MRLNPELQRYIWLEFSLQRLIVMPLVIAVVFFIAYQGNYPEEKVIITAKWAFLILIGLWGGNKAAASVIEEVNDNTWDFQRLSSLSPSSLTFGKLFGSTLYCWYGALMVLFVYVFMSTLIMPVEYVISNTIILVCAALICHSAALFASLQAIQGKFIGRGKIQAIGAHILGLGLGSLFISGLVGKNHQYIDNINWYGQIYNHHEFIVFFAVISLLWLIGGVYWQMRGQLRMRTGPWLWGAFTIYMMIFCAGFVRMSGFYNNFNSGLIVAYSVGLAFLYIMVLMEPWNGLSYRRLLDSWKNRNIKNFLHLFPRWLTTMIITFLVVIAIIVNFITVPMTVFTIIASLCFVVRDIALFHYFKFNPEARRANAAAFFYLFVLYALIPTLLSAIGLKDSLSLFFPVPINGQLVVSVFSASAQAALFIFLALGRWKKYWQ